MELYLDSANIKEIEEAFQLGFLDGLTTTPTFMHRDGITDIDSTIVRLSKIVPVLQVEALGKKADDVVSEAKRIINLGLDKNKTVFKIPISLEGAKACKMLRNEGFLVNLHLIYTVQQAYVALAAGANYVCPLVGRLQDQGHDALAVIEQCVDAVERYGYDTKIMFSSVRNPEHVRNALNLGAHVCTVPYSVLKLLTQNVFTEVGTQQFYEHTKLMTERVRDVISSETCTIPVDKTIMDALVVMTKVKSGAVTLVDNNNNIAGIFTDGDLRRMIKENGEGILSKKLSDLEKKLPVTIEADALLYESSRIFKEFKIDNIVVVESGKPVGMLDIQDIVE